MLALNRLDRRDRTILVEQIAGGFTERHRDTLAALDMPVILSNTVLAEVVGELFGAEDRGRAIERDRRGPRSFAP